MKTIILILLFSLCFCQDLKAEDLNIEAKIKEYEKHLLKINLDPIKLKIKMAEWEIEAWKGLRLRLISLREAIRDIHIEQPSFWAFLILGDKGINKSVESIQRVVDEYNNVMLYINNVRTFTPRLTYDEFLQKEKDFNALSYEEKRLSSLSGGYYKSSMKGDIQVIRLKRNLEYTMKGTPYPRDIKKTIKLFVEIGLELPDSTKSNLDRIGYVFLNKNKLKHNLRLHYYGVSDLLLGNSKGILTMIVEIIDSYAKRAMKNKKTGKSITGIIETKIQILEYRVKISNKRLVIVKRKIYKKIESFKRRTGGGLRPISPAREAKIKRKEMERKLGGLKGGQ